MTRVAPTTRPMIGSTQSGRTAPKIRAAARGPPRRRRGPARRASRGRSRGAAPRPSRADRGAAREPHRRGQRGRSGALVVGVDLAPTAVLVTVAVGDLGEGAVLLAVGGDAGVGGRRRAGDVGDRRDMVPVDPVADAEEGGGDEEADRLGRRGHGQQWGGQVGGTQGHRGVRYCKYWR